MGGGEWHCPDYTKYRVEDINKLIEYEAKLAEHGLKDPWTRNYVWKYLNPITNNSNMRWYKQVFAIPGAPRGMVCGVGAVLAYIAIDQTLRRTGMIKESEHGHH